ncbi:MAG: hypothetical protein HFJ48_06185 [Clostridia bacterium]|nr:hypothetical protein [Clostridia bacterium]
MKNIIKILGKIILVILLIQALYIPKVQATNYWENVIDGADSFVETGKQSTTTTDKEKIQDAIDFIYNTLLLIGIAASVIIGVILGMKYMTQSSEEQAKVKETLVAYAIGCIVTFGAFGIWKVVILLLKQV